MTTQGAAKLTFIVRNCESSERLHGTLRHLSLQEPVSWPTETGTSKRRMLIRNLRDGLHRPLCQNSLARTVSGSRVNEFLAEVNPTKPCILRATKSEARGSEHWKCAEMEEREINLQPELPP